MLGFPRQQQKHLGELLHVGGGAPDPQHRVARRRVQLLLTQQHVGGDLDHRERASELVACVPGEVSLPLRELVDAARQPLQRVGKRHDFPVRIAGQAFAGKHGGIGRLRIQLVHLA